MNNHLSDYQLNELINKRGDEKAETYLYEHIQSCLNCRERLAVLRSIDEALRDVETPVSDTKQVNIIMDRVRSAEGQFFGWVLGVRFAYIAAMILVLGAVGWVFSSFDIIMFSDFTSGITIGQGTLGEYLKTLQTGAVQAQQMLTQYYQKYLGDIMGNAGVILFFLLAVIALLDRWVLEPLIRRST
jgi:hypothetical protein